jgi:hypothetical protein
MYLTSFCSSLSVICTNTLFFFSSHPRPHFYRLLIEKGTDVLVTNTDGLTPFHIAEENGCQLAVQKPPFAKRDVSAVKILGLVPPEPSPVILVFELP